MMRLVNIVVFCAAIAAIVVETAADRTFLIGPSGTSFSGASAGYVHATLADMQSPKFLSVYNALGLDTLQGSMPSPAAHCPFVAVAEGVIATGSALNPTPTVVAPFASNEVPQLGVGPLVSPVWLGFVNSSSPSTDYSFVGPLNSSTLAALFTLPVTDFQNFAFGCDFENAHYAIFTRAAFVIAGYGLNFPNAPYPNAELVNLDDLASDNFIEAFNTNGLEDFGETVQNGCCAFRVAKGYLSLSDSTVAPYSATSETSQCPTGRLTNPVWFGTDDWGQFPSAYIGPLNSSTLAMLTTPSSIPSACSASQNAWGIFKYHPNSPPTPSPAPIGDCYKMELQVSYYLPDGTICLAERWTYYMKMNKTYASVAMSSINECGGSIGAVSAFDLELVPYNSDYMIGRTTGATNCDCSSGVKNWAFIPYNESGHNSMQVLCNLPIQVYYFCEVLAYVRGGPVQCPPQP